MSMCLQNRRHFVLEVAVFIMRVSEKTHYAYDVQNLKSFNVRTVVIVCTTVLLNG